MKNQFLKVLFCALCFVLFSKTNAQTTYQFTSGTEGWAVQVGTSLIQAADSGTDGVAVFTLGVSNSYIKNTNAINCDVNKYVSIKVKNSSLNNQIRVVGASNTPARQVSITDSSNTYETYVFDLSADPTWVGTRTNLGFQFRGGGADAGPVKIDEISFYAGSSPVADYDKPVIYPFYVDPTEYPNYSIKSSTHQGVVSWGAIGNKMLIRDAVSDDFGTYTRISLEYLEEDFETRASLFAGYLNSGVVEQLSIRGIGKMNLSDSHGYTGKVADQTVNRIRTDFGDAFAGFDNGEADQEYIRDSRSWGYPKPRTKKGHFDSWNNFYHNYEVSAHYQVRAISDYHAWHYTSKYGSAALIGNQGQPRDDVGLAVAGAMTRGAGKQYGTLWAGKYANQHRFIAEIGAKREMTAAKKAEYQAQFDYWDPIYQDPVTQATMTSAEKDIYKRAKFGIQGDVEGGPSFSVLRNHLFTAWLRNNTSIASETPFRSEDVGGGVQPVGVYGTTVAGFNQMQTQYGLPGQLYVSSAFMMDYFSGWKPPQTEAFDDEQDPFEVWAQHPYDEGDFFTLSMFDFMYPGFQNQAWTREQRYIHPATPHGETDAILSDVRQEILNQYGMLVVTGKIETDIKLLRPKLEKFLDESRTLVITADNAKRIFSDWGLGAYSTVSANTVVFADGSGNVTEDHTYELASIGSLASNNNITNYEVISTSNGNPAAVKFNYGSSGAGNKGKVVLLLSPFGINKDRFAKGTYTFPNIEWHRTELDHFVEMNDLIGSPHVMLKHVEKIIAKEYDVRKIFNFGSSQELTALVNRKSANTYTIGLFNGTLGAENYEINYPHGSITSITRIDTYDATVTSELGFKPKGFHSTNVGTTTVFSSPGGSKVLAGNDMVLYEVVVSDESGINVLSQQTITPRAEKTFFATDDVLNLKDYIMSKPSFFEYFDGVKVDAKDLLGINDVTLDSVSSWTKNQGLKFVIDGSAISSASELEDVMDKMDVLGGSDATDLITTSTDPAVIAAALNKGVSLHDGTNSSDFIYIRPGTDPATALNGKGANTVVVFDMEYDDWDALYDDYELIFDPASNPSGQIQGTDITSYVPTSLSAVTANGNHYLTVRGIEDIKEYISKNKDFFNYFGGVCLPSAYLRNLSDARLQEDVVWLTARNIDLVIDFMDDLDFIHYNLDYQFPERVAKTISLFDDTFVIMQSAGLTNALFSSSQQKKSNDFQQIDHLKDIAASALTFGIKMHYRPAMNRRFGENLQTDTMNRIIDTADNIYLAPTFVRTESEQIEDIHITSSYTEFVILAAAGDDTGSVAIPIGEFANSFSTPTTVNLDVSNSVFNGKKLVFDAEYLDWSEVQGDLTYMNVPSQNVYDPNAPACGDIISDSFDSNFGNWNQQGSNSNVYRSKNNVVSPLYSVRLRADGGVSYLYSNVLDLSTESQVYVDFSYYPKSMETGETFSVELSLDGGATYSNVKTFTKAVEFYNNTRYFESVPVSGFAFTNNCVFRFINNGSDTTDKIFLDDVIVTTCDNSTASKSATSKVKGTDSDFEEGIKVYPNPATSDVFIDCRAIEGIGAEISIFSMTSRLLYTASLDERDGYLHKVDLSRLTEGIYILRIIDEDGLIVKNEKVVIKR